MIHQPVLVNGEWCEASFPVSSFKAVSPTTSRQLQESFPVSSFLDIDAMLQAEQLQHRSIEAISQQQRAEMLRLAATEIEKHKEELVKIACAETALSESFLRDIDLPVCLENLRQAADCCSPMVPLKKEGKQSCFSIRKPLCGPVVIFAPACQPFSLNSCGGKDFACAIAAGNSVLAKANPFLPMTSMKLAQIIHSTIKSLGFPPAVFQFFFNTTNELGYRLAAHPLIGALAFTGNRRNGMALKENTDRAGNPGFFSMSSINPAFLLPAAITGDRSKLAKTISEAVLFNQGQNCQKPGIIFLVEDKESSSLIKSVVEDFNLKQGQPLLSDLAARNLDTLADSILRAGARKLTKREFYQPNPFLYPNTILTVDYKTFRKNPVQFQQELFGPATLFVLLENEQQMLEIPQFLEGSRMASVFSSENDNDLKICKKLVPALLEKCGHIKFNGFGSFYSANSSATGSGTYPSVSDPGTDFTSLPASIDRFTSLKCLESIPDRLLNDN